MTHTFLFPHPNLNSLGVVIASLIAGSFGMIWFGPLFGRTWQTTSRWSQKKMAENLKEMPVLVLAGNIGTGLTCFVLANLIEGLRLNLCDSLILAALIWIAFKFAAQLRTVLWEGENPIYFTITSTFSLVSLLLMVLVYHAVPRGGLEGLFNWFAHGGPLNAIVRAFTFDENEPVITGKTA
jgi:hypothetical protein